MDKDKNAGDFAGGEIFILEMGTPIKIDQMARDLIRLCGKEPDTEIEIKYSGIRPGEKLYEELITEGEGIVPTDHEKILVLRPKGLGPEIRSLAELNSYLTELKILAKSHEAEVIKKKLRELVSDYTPRDTGSVL